MDFLWNLPQYVSVASEGKNIRSDMEKLRMNFKGPIFRFRFNNETGEEIDPQLFKIVFREICFELNADGCPSKI